MKIQLKFFSVFRDRFRTDEREIETEVPRSAREIFLGLFDDQPRAEKFLKFTRFAVNWEYVPEETILKDGDELALIPPVSGG